MVNGKVESKTHGAATSLPKQARCESVEVAEVGGGTAASHVGSCSMRFQKRYLLCREANTCHLIEDCRVCRDNTFAVRRSHKCSVGMSISQPPISKCGAGCICSLKEGAMLHCA